MSNATAVLNISMSFFSVRNCGMVSDEETAPEANGQGKSLSSWVAMGLWIPLSFLQNEEALTASNDFGGIRVVLNYNTFLQLPVVLKIANI